MLQKGDQPDKFDHSGLRIPILVVSPSIGLGILRTIKILRKIAPG
jgi:hypothetical protein